MSDFFSSYDNGENNQPISNTPSGKPEGRPEGRQGGPQGGGQGGGYGYAEEIFSESLQTPNRTYFVDYKLSPRGRYLKISEKSRGRKSTIMLDEEDILDFYNILSKVVDQIKKEDE
ncbi:hypothetical protein COB57_03490 [Candidatus Peregrinibacteria bacterium]|nr:MAG: hypothetical protein COB57_03490 [Candidatus Peregrinibacteria bacterium]